MLWILWVTFLLSIACTQRLNSNSRFPCTTPKGHQGVCTYVHECEAVHYQQQEHNLAECFIVPSTNIMGICCPVMEEDPDDRIPMTTSLPVSYEEMGIPLIRVEIAEESALKALRLRDELEQKISDNGIFLSSEDPSFRHRAFLRTSKEALELGRQAFLLNAASENLLKSNLTIPGIGMRDLNVLSFRNTHMESFCPKQPTCSETKYRSVDGSCNNLRNRDWGKALRALNRLLRPKYSDGVSRPKVSVMGIQLPSPRELSVRIARDVDKEIPYLTQITMAWGQWVTHDMSLSPLATARDNSPITCCSRDRQHLPPNLRHPECFAIDIPPDDFFFSRFRQTCMEFVRTMPGQRPDCRVGPREQMSQNTAYIDASQMYGSDQTTASDLRSFSGGQLKTGRSSGGNNLLPPASNAQNFMFKAGDPRVNEQMLLTTLHTLWMREHNRIAVELSRFNPRWNDEMLYQETRRIVGALQQHITFSEYLPVVLGNRIMKRYKIQLLQSGFSSYDSNVDATLLNEFSTAGHRYGHSLITSRIVFFNEGNLSPATSSRLHQMFFNPNWLHAPGGVDRFTRCLATQNPMAMDAYLSFDVTNLLFQNDHNQPGLDLASFNIQRGRDHGLPGYNDIRRICGETELKSFKDLESIMSEDVVTEMARLYRDVEDIDLWLGIISEAPVSGGVIGPTGACIVAEQMRRLKYGDRFFYEHGNMANSFSEAQLTEIRKVTLARIFCDNSDLRQIQPLIFYRPSRWNSVRSCASIPHMDLRPWMNEPIWNQ